jgi:hypothetical protein
VSAKKKRKITVLLPYDEFRRFEEYCESKGFKKSTLLARLIRDHLDQEKFMLQSNLPFGQKQSRT